MTLTTGFFTILIFLFTIGLIIWRPRGLNEAVPAAIGAVTLILIGSVSFHDLIEISSKVTEAAITIIATMVMAIALESFGFFHWAATRLLYIAKGSGKKLYWLTNLLCFFMTIVFNNDGSILITTPILLLLLRQLSLKKHQMLPYLISGAIIATASSAPIGVSNIVNLISLKIIGMSLYQQTAMMFVPSVLGLIFLAGLLYLVFSKEIPDRLPPVTEHILGIGRYHPLKPKPNQDLIKKQTRIMVYVILFILCMRILLFLASFIGIPIAYVAITGSIGILAWRYFYLKLSAVDIIKKAPWHIFVFAYSMYVIVYGLHNIGLTKILVKGIEPILSSSLLSANLTMGILLTILSNIFNNHPALMIGTISLSEMQLDPITMKAIYLSTIIGSDIGSLLLPVGTLATLLWLNSLRQQKFKIKWLDYIRVSVVVIPPTIIFTLICLYVWIRLIFI
ncbi:arsenic transporter [Heyndrickxia camelliae]|uniref:Arsenic transporter n=1 Tax=Heyndrickxia camelliae TaxID=1707093 RepID=A0A2N3LK04_9BACI|nr:arsenic transporter [Heyndrickxia camelliae]PKR84960.1 arsenic transporter [Heyndrickxia camelliae]